jgi:hypothetical protein
VRIRDSSPGHACLGIGDLGSALEGDALTIDVATSTAKVALSCKHAKRSVGAKCNDKQAPPIDVLDCYVAGYTEPMPFGLAPGIEYVADAAWTGYRLRAP